ncbi:MAG: hypothetical protein ACPGOV_03465 [Magnetovibrionaceae bacterium]
MIRNLPLTAAVLACLITLPAAAEQKGDAGKPLSEYCNTVPDLSVQRTDQVDNWTRICTIWLAHNCPAGSRGPGDQTFLDLPGPDSVDVSETKDHLAASNRPL